MGSTDPPLLPRLLLVEDDRMVRETIELMLEDDYELQMAVSVRTALAYLRSPASLAVDVILLDCLLPDGKLGDVLMEATLRSIPVVLISGDPRQAEAIDSNRPFLPKPFTQATLLDALDTARR
jgi:DNA-binding NtrC family response regulator